MPVLPNVVLRIGGGKRLARGFEPRLHAVVHKERQQIGRVGRFLGPCLKGFGVFQHVGAEQFFGPDVAPDQLIPDKLRSRAELRQGFRHFQDRAEKLLGPLRIDGELLPGQQRRPLPMLHIAADQSRIDGNRQRSPHLTLQAAYVLYEFQKFLRKPRLILKCGELLHQSVVLRRFHLSSRARALGRHLKNAY